MKVRILFYLLTLFVSYYLLEASPRSGNEANAALSSDTQQAMPTELGGNFGTMY